MFGKTIRELRLKKRKKISELATHVGINDIRYSMIEHERIVPTEAEARKIDQVLGSPEGLLQEIVEIIRCTHKETFTETKDIVPFGKTKVETCTKCGKTIKILNQGE